MASDHLNNPNYQPPFFADDTRLAKIQALFPMINNAYKKHAEEKHFPGYAFGIMVDGQLVHSGSGGVINIDQGIPATPQSMFRIASMTKSLTAMAIIKLRDMGKLRLDDPVFLYVPEIKNQRLTQDSPEATIRDLLTHSAGFPQDDPWGDRNLHWPDDKLIEVLKKGISFSNAVGIVYEYSNLTFAILGRIIKQVSGGTSCQEFITEMIWKPLNMEQAAWEFSKVPSSQLAHGYKWANDHWENETLLHDGCFGAMGGMITSIESFSRYVSLHQSAWPPRDDADKAFIKRSSIREMHQPWRFNELDPHFKCLDGHQCVMMSAYAYGLRWFRDGDGKTYIGHGGGLPGFGSNWLMMPDHGIGTLLFANVTYASTFEINLKILNILITEAKLAPRQLPVSSVLQHRKNSLIKLLPGWDGAETSGLFAENFFLDNSINSLIKETMGLFEKVGKIVRIGEIIPENQLRGYFIMEGENYDIKINFTLTPQCPALIQEYRIEEVMKEKNW